MKFKYLSTIKMCNIGGYKKRFQIFLIYVLEFVYDVTIRLSCILCAALMVFKGLPTKGHRNTVFL